MPKLEELLVIVLRHVDPLHLGSLHSAKMLLSELKQPRWPFQRAPDILVLKDIRLIQLGILVYTVTSNNNFCLE